MEDFEWNVTHEGQLLDAMVGHKPVGINKNFQMAFICDKFTETLQKDINSDKIWNHLATMYNLEALDESELIPFPNSEKDFLLPDLDFAPLITKKDGKTQTAQKGRETPKNVKEIKKEEKTSTRKEMPRRDSKDCKTPLNSSKKEAKKEPEKGKGKGKQVGTPKETGGKTKNEDTPKPVKRPTRGSLKPDDTSSSGKSSPVNVAPPVKRRRI